MNSSDMVSMIQTRCLTKFQGCKDTGDGQFKEISRIIQYDIVKISMKDNPNQGTYKAIYNGVPANVSNHS